jgi:hypothetical protein
LRKRIKRVIETIPGKGMLAGRYNTASSKNISRYQRNFLSSFPVIELKGKKRAKFVVSRQTNVGRLTSHYLYESPVSIVLHRKSISKTNHDSMLLGRIDLGFEKEAVIVESIKGVKGSASELDRFKSMHKKHGLEFLVQVVEEQAKKTGFKEVKIRDPETLHAFNDLPLEHTLGEVNKIRQRMIELYKAVADARGYTRKGNFYVKEL